MTFRRLPALALALLFAAGSAHAQVGKSLGVVDANTASEQDCWPCPT